MNISIIGSGLIGAKRARAIASTPEAQLKVVCDIDRERAEALAAQFDCEFTVNWGEVINREDVDVVIVATTNNFLCPITVAALQNGKHVLCEKPLGRNPDEGQQMYETAKRYGKILKTGFNHRHHPAVWKAKELFDQGRIGELMFLRCRYGHGGRPGMEDEWRSSVELCGGGEMLDQGVHCLDLFRWFAGDFAEAFGYVSTQFWDIEVEDNAFALFRTTNGIVAQLHVSWTQWKNLFSFEIFGKDGYLTVNGLGRSYGKETLTIGKRCSESGMPEEQIFEFKNDDESWELEWKEFISAIKEHREPLANGYDGWQAVKMVYAVYESSQKRCVVKL